MEVASEILKYIPKDIINFLLVVLFSLLIGMEQRRRHISQEVETLFGTDRTSVFIGILGFILYVLSPNNLIPFLGGGVVVAVLLAVFYYQKAQIYKKLGMTSVVIALITYCFTPLIYTQPKWLVISIVVTVLVIAELKESLFKLSQKFDDNEFITLAKFLVVAGVVLPLLPDAPISEEINISPYKFWLAIVVVSGISYISYLLKKFVFPKSGIVLTGILGGLYSSTATTIILAKKSKELQESNKVAASIILATTMMYVRIFLLAFFFNRAIAHRLLPSFSIFIVVSVLFAVYLLKFYNSKNSTDEDQSIEPQSNPLEFKTALIFAGLFILFGLITGYVSRNYGTGGVNVLSFIVGVTDIDPFILNLFQSKWDIEITVLVMTVLNAITSNNALKMIYGISFGDKNIRKPLIVGFSILVVIGLILAFGIQF